MQKIEEIKEPTVKAYRAQDTDAKFQRIEVKAGVRMKPTQHLVNTCDSYLLD